jgi:hypothetical protein
MLHEGVSGAMASYPAEDHFKDLRKGRKRI